MKNKAYFIKNLARLTGKSEDDPWIQSFRDRQIVDILLEIKKVREDLDRGPEDLDKDTPLDTDTSLWSRIFGA